jgi:hypothetical protein
MLTSRAGKALAAELKSVLEKLMAIAKIMESYQRKLLQLACKKVWPLVKPSVDNPVQAGEAITMMKNTSHGNQLQEKFRLYNMHIDNLLNLTATRMEIFEQTRYLLSLGRHLGV